MLQLAKENARTVLPLLSRRRSSSLFVNIEAPQCQGGFPFFCRYGIAMTSNMVAVPWQQTCQLGSSTLFFCLTVLAAIVDARRTFDLFLQFGHIIGDGSHRSTSTSGLFGLCLGIGGSSSRLHVFPAPRTHRLRAGKIFAQASSSDL